MSDQTSSPAVPGIQAFLKGLPWVCLIPVFAFLSWKVWTPILQIFMPASTAAFASIGVSTMGAYVICLIALAGNWPVAGIGGTWARGIAMIVIAKALAAVFFIVLHSCFSVSLEKWAFPIIANSWLVLAATSFVGGDWHLSHIPPVRRMFLNLLISAGITILLMRTILIFPSYWFTFLQVIIVTGGLSYLFRRVPQPTFSVLSWSLLMLLMFVMFGVASLFGQFTLNADQPAAWAWNLGTGTMEFGLFIAITCGMNFAVFACTQCWPFCHIKQPWGTVTALFSVLIWCYLLTLIAIPLFESLVPGDGALWEAQVMAWHTVFWGFAWVYCFGVGQTPYLWVGQKTPGTWDDVD